MLEKSNIHARRKKLGLTQEQFWKPVGVTQSGGSRYENGRDIPLPVQQLIELRYGKTPLKTLAKLRHPSRSDKLRSFLDNNN